MWYYENNCDVELYNATYNNLRSKQLPIIDSPNTWIVLPEINNPLDLAKEFPNSNLVYWWLAHGGKDASFFNDPVNRPFFKNMVHGFQAHSIYERISKEVPYLNDNQKFLLYDYTRLALVDSPLQKNKIRTKVILYNPVKDNVTPRVAKDLGLTTLALQGMNQQDLIKAGSNSIVYSDFGGHPGKDRFPREMAVLGCVVVTSKHGTANDSVDIPIEEKADNESQLAVLLSETFNNYKYYYKKQQNYRDVIHGERREFKEQIKALFDRPQVRHSKRSMTDGGSNLHHGKSE